ncbi:MULTISPECIES: preprotein translocase subunit SecY [Tissierellales]|jgi:preprotein translocase subunit SecY|uniref:Protein translocase subunit SecY n=1 Tax=Acidilutibacter cellobiosedens TaxID=2507161 RepID=A0A410QF06_9FIRM|nr:MULTISPECIES: preprotein translocase subunit SecY [Tissierellales]MBE6082756.1 preprotein translocase subunit SecY [Tissierellaceae bacterium]QAT62653.1 preprotein translocase subunit SecY [Acidilutibacter cellobiosedens]SCL90200.1 preprotein translocase subunit SecY [Sporanaerobacter sp. PP17-6a]
MLKTLRNAWRIPDIRKKIIFTLWMLLVFRLGSFIPVPFINKDVIKQIFQMSQGGVLQFLDLMAGGTFSNFSIFALNIYPYVTASIIIQLLTIAIPRLEEVAKEGEEGRKKMAKWTKYTTIVLSLIQSIAMAIGFFNKALISTSFLSITVVVTTLTAGTSLLMWIGDLITSNGIGNGISLIIFIGIISRLPAQILGTYEAYKAGTLNVIGLILFLVFALAIIAIVVALQEGERKIPVQYAKRVVGRKMYGGQSTHIPIKVSMAGVIPVIFSTSLLAFPQTLSLFFKGKAAAWITKYLTVSGTAGTWIYTILNALLIIFFTYFYTAIQFNTVEYSKNLQQYGGFIPGIRPGRPTVEYLNKVISRITFVGAISLALIASLPIVLSSIFKLNINFGGTALIIVVGVALETVKQIESQMLMRHYKGFLK